MFDNTTQKKNEDQNDLMVRSSDQNLLVACADGLVYEEKNQPRNVGMSEMPYVTGLSTGSWSTPETLTKKTLFQARRGGILVDTGSVAPATDSEAGIKLGIGDAIELDVGVTVYFKQVEAGSALNRTELEA